jgi:hypothetical protein
LRYPSSTSICTGSFSSQNRPIYIIKLPNCHFFLLILLIIFCSKLILF